METVQAFFEQECINMFSDVAYCYGIAYKKGVRAVLKSHFYSVCSCSFDKNNGKESNFEPFKWCTYCNIIDGIILLRVISNPISGQLLPFYLVQNDLTEWAITLGRVTYSNLAFRMLFINCVSFYLIKCQLDLTELTNKHKGY